ncbi:MAG: methyltransferase [Eubacteriales bacterium]|nr:methyltransferase [Eubacteriales bacterium]
MSQRHYFNAPEGEGEIKTHSYELDGLKLQLKTSAGIFAKRGFDEGSRLLLKAIKTAADEQPDWQPDKILDLGCGNGVLGLFMAKFWPEAEISLVDLSPRAVELARMNCQGEKNLQVFEADGLNLNSEGQMNLDEAAIDLPYFQLCVTNPPIRAGKELCYRLYAEVEKALLAGGSFYLVVRKKQGAESHRRELERLFPEVERVLRDRGYQVFRAHKPLLAEGE